MGKCGTPLLARVCAAATMFAAVLLSAPIAGAVEVNQDPADVRQYWTDERMRSALPGSDLLAGVELPLLAEVDELLPGELQSQPAPRAAAESVPNPDRSPLRTHGKVYFTLSGTRYVCSGSVVRAETRSLVVSAGHCVYGFGQFASNWLFVPAKNGSSEPYGRWAAVELDTTRQWRSSEDIRYDVGMATLERRNRRPIQRKVGGRKIAFNQGRNLTFKAFGYPAQGRFNGEYLYRCKSPAQGTDSGPAPQPTRIDCDMTGGSSGGGWVISRGRVNSVVSYGYECGLLDLLCQVVGGNPEEGKLFGPYFGETIRQLYRRAQRR
ncbi:MAG: hypothetical protein M3383_00200 [Actinomycetota bacterium]|nr:hypothetical protein [Actinomycetota bacterium]